MGFNRDEYILNAKKTAMILKTMAVCLSLVLTDTVL